MNVSTLIHKDFGTGTGKMVAITLESHGNFPQF